MKKIYLLKLNQLSNAELKEREMNQLLGGSQSCGCGCNGPSSTVANANTNWYYGYAYSAGEEKRCQSWYDQNGNPSTVWEEHW